MRQRSALVLRAVAVAFLVTVSGQAMAGTYVEQKVSSSQKGMNMTAHAWMDDESGRVEFVKSDSDLMPKGSYLLTVDGGDTAHLINPKKRTYSKWDIDSMFVSLGELFKGAEGVVDLEFKDAEAEDLGTEPGGQILGVETTKKSWRTGYSMEMKVVFMKRKQRFETRTDAWLTNDVSIPTLENLWFAVRPPKTGKSELDIILIESMKRVDGTPLKVVQNTTVSRKKNGRGKSTEITMEIVALREEVIDPDLFAMPEGYDEVPLIDFSDAGTDEKRKKDDGDDPLKDLGDVFKD